MAGAGTYLALTANRGEVVGTTHRGPTFCDLQGICRTDITVGIKRAEPETAKFVAGVGLGISGAVVAVRSILR